MPKRLYAVGQHCAEASCDRQATTKGYCNAHHLQSKRVGRTQPLREKLRPVIGDRILCSTCKRFRPQSEFGKRKSGYTRASCRSCVRDYQTDSSYGAGAAQWKRQRFAEQGGRCHLCGTTDGDRTGWCLDHNHETDKWRSVICRPCNIVLGYVEKGWHAWAFVETLNTSDDYGDRVATVRSIHAGAT